MHAMGVTLQPGDHVIYRSNGGGGFGLPLTRDPALVLADVESGWLTADRAKDAYGVVIITDDPAQYRVDLSATATKRAELSRRTRTRGYGFGEVHPSGESVSVDTEANVA